MSRTILPLAGVVLALVLQSSFAGQQKQLRITDGEDQAGARSARARALRELSETLLERGKPAEAEAGLRQALALTEALVADFPNVPAYRRDLAGCLRQLGDLHQRLGKFAEAEALFRKAAAVREKLAADFPKESADQLALAESTRDLGVLLTQTGRLAEAEAAFRKALALEEKLAEQFPEQPTYRRALVQTHRNLGSLFGLIGRPRDAEASLRRAMDLLRQLLESDTPERAPGHQAELAATLEALAVVFEDQGKRDEARRLKEQAAEIRRKLEEKKK